jgi:hypothetical protein
MSKTVVPNVAELVPAVPDAISALECLIVVPSIVIPASPEIVAQLPFLFKNSFSLPLTLLISGPLIISLLVPN